MVDVGGSAAISPKVASSVSSAPSTGPANNSPATQSQANQVFSLSARILAAREPDSPVQATSRQIDPALLARIALEEELKRQGGGGGGGPKFTSPTLFVLYSMRLINDAMREAYEALQKALDQAGQNITAPFTNTIAAVQESMNNFIANPLFTNLGTAINQSFAQIAKALNDPAVMANKLVNNFAQFGSVVASAIANGLKRLFYGKDEDRLETDNNIYEGEDGIMNRILGMFININNQGNESNAKNIKSHIDNLAKQVTKWVTSLNHPFQEFAKRWFN